MKKWLWLCALVCLMPLRALAEDAFTALLPTTGGTVEIVSKTIEDEPWLFLPAHADLSTLTLRMGDGEPFTFEPELLEEDDEGVYSTEVPLAQDETVTLYLMQSQNLRAFYLYSDDPVNQGREWIEEGETHQNRTTGRMAIVNVQGVQNHADALTQLRGRGNGTWGGAKKPYQFKLTDRADLLQTGDPAEKNRTWVLLAEMSDPTQLHNRLALDLGLDMGIEETSHSEYVDLYYDGDYRGTYLLAEKVEVNEGRIDILDYDKLLKRWNKRVGQPDLALLPAAEGTDAYGNEVHYVDGVITTEDPLAGGYLIEMEGDGTISDRCYFRLKDDWHYYAFKNPENPSKEMAMYISQLLQEGMSAVRNGGVNPETGKPVEAYFDLDSYAKLGLLAELSANSDALNYSSTYFILQAGETRFSGGPVWDYDLAWRNYISATVDRGRGLVRQDSFLAELYECEAFQQALKNNIERLEFLVKDVLLGTEHAAHVKPYDEYIAELAASRRMNERLWPMGHNIHFVFGEDSQRDRWLMKRFLADRIDWLGSFVRSLGDASTLALQLDVVYANMESTQRITPCYPWQQAEVQSLETSQLTEADEENYALWQTDVVLEPGIEEGVTITVNGTEVPYERLEDGAVAFSFLADDRTYRPLDYYGEDMGMVLDLDYYSERYPEVVEECDGDPEAILDYFYYDGMALGQQGNEAFSPHDTRRWNEFAYMMFREDWPSYYTCYIEERASEWMLYRNRRYQPYISLVE